MVATGPPLTSITMLNDATHGGPGPPLTSLC